MIVRIDPALPTPVHEQLVTQVIAAIDRSAVRPGDRLPTVRQLAADLGVAPGTVARAYRTLEDGGWIVTRGRRGTAVAERPSDTLEEDVRRAAAALAAAARAADLSPADAHRALDVALAHPERT